MEIMSISSRVLAVTSISLVASSSLFASDVVLHKVPPLTIEQAPAYPDNLARYHFGAQVEAAPDAVPVSSLKLSSGAGDRNTAESALLCDDPTTGYALAGDKTLLVTLSKIENIDKISFLNRGVKGTVSVAISNAKLTLTSDEWHVVADQDLSDVATVNAKVGPSEAKYVRLTFKVTEPGRIAALGVYASPTVAAFTMPRARQMNVDRTSSFGLISYNLSDVHAKSRALYVSSGDEIREANNMIDDQSATTYTFAPNDPQPTAIIDLGKMTSLRRITAIYTPRPGTVNFYVLQSLPGNAAAKAMKLDDAALAKMKAVGSVTDGTGRAAIDFPETTGRYILVKWAGATDSNQPFSIAEIAAFGGSRGGNLIAANTTASNPEEGIESDGKAMADGKDLGAGKDMGKEMPEEGPESPAEGPPPPLEPPPPFALVPEILPTSP
jgi:hypothetical protein